MELRELRETENSSQKIDRRYLARDSWKTSGLAMATKSLEGRPKKKHGILSYLQKAGFLSSCWFCLMAFTCITSVSDGPKVEQWEQ